ncbi:MAG: glycosyltransferase family 4 protein [Bacteroidales bacterium]|jgi:glycosyltransferase involved in cell wall biosynthesis|nr:glycosyltransferase family 4 protein [Bacteroidales bacterium]
MKALMFGWEFPPHILGGLGTASYGLIKGMSRHKDIDITLVLPKPWGDEDQSFLKIIAANKVPIVWQEPDSKFLKDSLEGRISSDEYYHFRNCICEDNRYIGTNGIGSVEFSGRYPDNLLEEIRNYEAVAGVVCRSNNFDIIHSHDWLTYNAGVKAKQITGKPLVIHVHATDFDRSRGNVNPTVYNIEKYGMDMADHIITVSNMTRDTVINKYHIDPRKVTTVHNAVTPLSREILDIKPNNNTGDKIVTFLGRITMQKGPEFFVQAARQVLQRTPNVRFVMAGGGDKMAEMVDLASAYGIVDRFHFTGFLKGKEVYEMLKSSDLYIMPSVSEPFGISPLEAMQCGVPTIVSKQSGCAEILSKVIKVDFWDIDAMADAIHSIVTNDAFAEYLKVEGKKEVDEIKWEYAGDKVINVYNQVLGYK